MRAQSLLFCASVAMAIPTPSANGFVETSWLSSHIQDSNIQIIDIRSADEYAAGHIAKSINIPFEVPFSAWMSYGPDDLLMQLPLDQDFFGNLSAKGIQRSKRIIISSAKAIPPFPQANSARAAMTLKLAGFSSIDILNGGYTQWVADGRAVTTVVPSLSPSGLTGQLDRRIIVERAYVHAAINKKIILDARDPSVYNGSVIEEWALKAGHIPSAKNLATVSLLVNKNENYKDLTGLKAQVKSVIGNTPKNTEIIIHCGVGGYAGSGWWVLTETLGYTNVKFYDGAAQDWVKEYDMVLQG